MTTELPRDLHGAIVTSGYFPEFVEATVAAAVGGVDVVSWVVHHEATFNRDEIHRHVTVLVLTPTRLVVGHTDDGEQPGVPQALSTVETVALRHIRSVALTQVVSNPEKFGRGRAATHATAETWLVVGWGAVRRHEVEPAGCADPACDLDHGYTVADLPDDLTVRMSVAADGEASVRQLIRFGTQLQQVTA